MKNLKSINIRGNIAEQSIRKKVCNPRRESDIQTSFIIPQKNKRNNNFKGLKKN